MNSNKEKIRINKFLWCIRLFKTRSQSALACDSGKVKQHGASIKASKQVAVGDEYEIKTEAKRWRIKVTELLHRRVNFELSLNYYMNITPSEELQRLQFQAASFHTGKRQSKIGRPTKKERRDLDDFLHI